MKFSDNKTKIVCTIGPASESQDVLEKMIGAGMNIARLNFSHSDFEKHAKVVKTLKDAASALDARVTIMGDLPGPKIRIGEVADSPVVLKDGDEFALTVDEIVGNKDKVFVNFKNLTNVVKPNDIISLNDGFIQLKVTEVKGNDVRCRILVGGELSSRKGVNLPGINLGISAFTDRDFECLKFAFEQGIDAVSQSFVETADDICTVRKAASDLGYKPFIIAKIERAKAYDNIDEILKVADGIMIARGDLGVELPIEQIAIVQKTIMKKAVLAGKPVITATQMLESMTVNSQPTRAEATDVSNAILDGTDCVMLSAESAMGKFPVQAVAMLSKIAEKIEPYRSDNILKTSLQNYRRNDMATLTDLITISVETTCARQKPAFILTPTMTGATARNVARFRPDVWVVAVSPNDNVCQQLQFSYGVFPVCELQYQENWKDFALSFSKKYKVNQTLVILTEGPSSIHPDSNHRMELINLG